MKLQKLVNLIQNDTYLQIFKKYGDNGDELIYYGNSSDFLDHKKTKDLLDAEIESIEMIPYELNDELKLINSIRSENIDKESGMIKVSANDVLLARADIDELKFRDGCLIDGFDKITSGIYVLLRFNKNLYIDTDLDINEFNNLKAMMTIVNIVIL